MRVLFTKSKKYKSIKSKMVNNQALIIIMVIFIITIVTYWVSLNLLIKDTMQVNSELVKVMNQSFDDMVTSFKRNYNYITVRRELHSLLKVEYENVNDNQFHVTNGLIHNFILSQSTFIYEIHGFYLYDNLGNMRVGFKRSYVPGEPDNIYPVLYPEDFSPFGNVTISEKDGSLLFKRKILDMDTQKGLGYSVIVFDKSYIEKHLNAVSPNENRFVVLLDEKGSVIEHSYTNNEAVGHIYESVSTTGNGSFIENIEGLGKSVVTINTSKLTDWSIVSVISVKSLSQSSATLSWIIMIIGIFGVMFGVIFTNISTKRLLTPITELTELVQKVDYNENFNLQFEYGKKDEIGTLGNSFNHMVNKIKSLITEVYFEEIKRKEAQMQALQAQVNPHFLYNTLDCINWLAEFNMTDKIKRVTIAFANIMKASARDEKKIMVESELEYARDFLTIYKVSLDNKLSYEIHAEEELLTLMIPKLILQPFIENAVVHGIKKRLEGGFIQINAFKRNDKAVFQIMDNGIGIPDSRLKEIREYVENRDIHGRLGGIGIKNTLDRLFIYYGENVEFIIESSESLGTLIEISIGPAAF